jgi:hypothetical protein
MDPWAATKNASKECGGDISCPGPYPTAACPEFHISCRLGRELFTLPLAAVEAHGVMSCIKLQIILSNPYPELNSTKFLLLPHIL